MPLSKENTLIVKSILIGVLAAVGTCAVLMCLCTAIFLCASSLPYGLLGYIMLGIETVGVTLGAYIGARISKKSGLLIGLCVAVVVYLALLIAGFTSSTESVGLLTALRAVLLLVGGALGGLKGVNRKEKIKIK